MMVGVLSSVIYAGLVGRSTSGPPALPVVVGAETLPPERVALFIVGLNIFGFIAVAALSGYLAERLRRTGAALEQTSNQIADLQAFSEHVISSLTSGLATTDIDGRILSFNKAAEAITGMPAPRRSTAAPPSPAAAAGVHRRFSGRARRGRGCRASSTASRGRRRPADRARHQHRHPA